MTKRVKYIGIGLLAGAANGFFGAGGGLFAVPLLIGWARLPQKQAFATSVAIIAPLCAVSAVVLLQQNGWPHGIWQYLVGGAVGGLLSGTMLRRASAVWLHRLFGALLLYGGLRAVLAW